MAILAVLIAAGVWVGAGLLWMLYHYGPKLPAPIVNVKVPDPIVIPAPEVIVRGPEPVVVPAPHVTVQAADPVVVPAPVVEVIRGEAKSRGKRLTLKLMDGDCRKELGVMQCDERGRPPQIKHKVGDTLSIFLQDHQEVDGTWVYRRVGVER